MNNMWQLETSATNSSPTTQEQINAAVQARTQQHEAMLATLIEEVRSLKASAGNESQPNTTARTNPKQTTSKAQKNIQHSQPKKTAVGRKSIPPKPPVTSMSTPKRAARATSAPAEVGNPKARKSPKDSKSLALTKVPSPRSHPQQMRSDDFPPEFTSTKVCQQLSIKLKHLADNNRTF